MSLHEALTGNTESEKAEWYNIIGQFRLKANEFNNAFNSLLARKSEVSQNPQLNREWELLVNRGTTIKNRIQSVTGTIDTVATWIDSVFDGYDTDNNLGSLNAVWIPVAVVVAGVTAVSKWLFDYLTFSNKLAEIQRLQLESGLSPQAATNIVNSVENQSKIASILKSVFPFLLLGGAIILNRGKF